MTTQSLKRLLEFTFTFVGSFVQDGLGRHNFAIPSGKRQEHRIQDEWVDKVTTRQQEESAPTTCMPIFINFPWLPDYRRKTRIQNPLCNHLCAFNDLKRHWKLRLTPPSCLCSGRRTVTLFPDFVFEDRGRHPRAKNNLFPACLYQTHTHRLTH